MEHILAREGGNELIAVEIMCAASDNLHILVRLDRADRCAERLEWFLELQFRLRLLDAYLLKLVE